MDRAFNRVFHDAPGTAGGDVFPPVNVWEDEDHLFLEAELPGLSMESLEIYVKDKDLVLSGERKSDDREGASFHRRERGVGRFSRTLRLPINVNSENVEARLRDGVLSLTLPKAEEAKPRKIEVRCV
jgi:HSP20 family protein